MSNSALFKTAVVGAGFGGLAAAWKCLKRGWSVDLFDPKGVGGGASGIATGLLHPYPGEQGRRSLHAEEALQATHQLLEIAETHLGRKVADRSGILRLPPLLSPGSDVVPLPGKGWLITSGITVFVSAYLEGLWLACERKGARLFREKVEHLDALNAYDLVILAVGAEIGTFADFAVSVTKGQVIQCQTSAQLERSVVAKGYLAKGEIPGVYVLGSTYERSYANAEPDLMAALPELTEKMHQFTDQPFSVLDCRAGLRVSPRGHYFPLIEQIRPRCWAIAGFGSRGLLYHAYAADLLLQKAGLS